MYSLPQKWTSHIKSRRDCARVLSAFLLQIVILFAGNAFALTQRMFIPPQPTITIAGGGGTSVNGSPVGANARAYCLDEHYAPPNSDVSFHATNMGNAVVQFQDGATIPLAQAISEKKVAVMGSNYGYDEIQFLNLTDGQISIHITEPAVLIPNGEAHSVEDIADVYDSLKRSINDQADEEHEDIQDKLWELREKRIQENISNIGINLDDLNKLDLDTFLNQINNLAINYRKARLPGSLFYVLKPSVYRSALGTEPIAIIFSANTAVLANGYEAMRERLEAKVSALLQTQTTPLQFGMYGNNVDNETYDKLYLNLLIAVSPETLSRLKFGVPDGPVPPGTGAWTGQSRLPPPLLPVGGKEKDRKSLTQEFPEARIKIRLSADFWRPVIAGMAKSGLF